MSRERGGEVAAGPAVSSRETRGGACGMPCHGAPTTEMTCSTCCGVVDRRSAVEARAPWEWPTMTTGESRRPAPARRAPWRCRGRMCSCERCSGRVIPPRCSVMRKALGCRWRTPRIKTVAATPLMAVPATIGTATGTRSSPASAGATRLRQARMYPSVTLGGQWGHPRHAAGLAVCVFSRKGFAGLRGRRPKNGT